MKTHDILRAATSQETAMTGAVAPRAWRALLLVAAMAAALSGCGQDGDDAVRTDSQMGDPCAVVLVRHSGSQPIDSKIRRLQHDVAKPHLRQAMLERLGWLFVSKARSTHDAGYFTLAEQSVQCLKRSQPGSVVASRSRDAQSASLCGSGSAGEAARGAA